MSLEWVLGKHMLSGKGVSTKPGYKNVVEEQMVENGFKGSLECITISVYCFTQTLLQWSSFKIKKIRNSFYKQHLSKINALKVS